MGIQNILEQIESRVSTLEEAESNLMTCYEKGFRGGKGEFSNFNYRDRYAQANQDEIQKEVSEDLDNNCTRMDRLVKEARDWADHNDELDRQSSEGLAKELVNAVELALDGIGRIAGFNEARKERQRRHAL